MYQSLWALSGVEAAEDGTDRFFHGLRCVLGFDLGHQAFGLRPVVAERDERVHGVPADGTGLRRARRLGPVEALVCQQRFLRYFAPELRHYRLGGTLAY